MVIATPGQGYPVQPRPGIVQITDNMLAIKCFFQDIHYYIDE